MAGKRIVMLTGAPRADSLDWDPACLLQGFVGPIVRFANITGENKSKVKHGLDVHDLTTVPDEAVWRSIPLERARLPSGFSKRPGFGFESEYGSHDGSLTYHKHSENSNGDVESDSSLHHSGARPTLLGDFYNHSRAVHDSPIVASQLALLEPTFNTHESFTTTTSSLANENHDSGGSSLFSEVLPSQGLSARLAARGLIHHGASPLRVHDLSTLPAAKYLLSITPQTMTVDLVVGLISIAEPRAVRTRQGSTKTLVELIVGDDTRAGFAITFWLSAKSNQDASATEAALLRLRRQDIVLLRNVALSEFRGKVHGHSLHKNLTHIDLLFRARLDGTDEGGIITARDLASVMFKKSGGNYALDGNQEDKLRALLEKTSRVHEWVVWFVRRDIAPRKTMLGKRKDRETEKKKETVQSWDLPPSDSL